MIDVSLIGRFEGEELRPTVIDREHIDREGAFHRGVFVKIVDDDLWIRVAFELDDHAGVFVGFVANRRDLAQNFLVHQVRDSLDQRCPVHVERNLGDDDLFFAALDLFDPRFAAHFHTATASLEILANTNSS